MSPYILSDTRKLSFIPGFACSLKEKTIMSDSTPLNLCMGQIQTHLRTPSLLFILALKDLVRDGRMLARNTQEQPPEVCQVCKKGHQKQAPRSTSSQQPPEAATRPANLLKKRPWHRCFPMNFAKFLRAPFFAEDL